MRSDQPIALALPLRAPWGQHSQYASSAPQSRRHEARFSLRHSTRKWLFSRGESLEGTRGSMRSDRPIALALPLRAPWGQHSQYASSAPNFDVSQEAQLSLRHSTRKWLPPHLLVNAILPIFSSSAAGRGPRAARLPGRRLLCVGRDPLRVKRCALNARTLTPEHTVPVLTACVCRA